MHVATELPMVLGVWINRQLVFDGLISGLVFGLLAMGIVLIYRSTRVINFAVGNMGLIASTLLPLLVLNYGWPFWIALVAALLLGVLFGAAVELTVVRRLFDAPRVILLVATVGVAQLAQFIVGSYPEIDAAGRKYPLAISNIWDDVYGIRIKGAQVTILIVVPALALLLGWIMNRTNFGKSVAASADNPELSRLARISPKRVSTMVWIIAGFLASLSMILLSANSGGVTGLTNLGPNTLGRAMVAAILAGMSSFPRAVAAGVAIGIAEKLIQFNSFDRPGLPALDFLLFVVVLFAVWFQNKSADEQAVFSFAPKVKPIPTRLQDVWWIKNLGAMAIGAFFLFAAVAIIFVDKPSRQLLYATILCYAVCGASVTIITGWSGQLSLSQMSFAGLGALFAAALNRGLEMDFTAGIPFSWIPGISSNLDLFDVQFQAQGIPFMLAIPLSALFGALAAAVIGATSLRLRGLYLAVVTFVFALAAQQYIYRRPFFSDGNNQSVRFYRGSLFGADLGDQRRYYWICLGFLFAVVVILIRLRKSGIGRTIIAVRDNSDTASAYTVGPTGAKLSAFALAGGVAALGGSLLSGLIQSVPVSERFFQVGDSLAIVGLVVIGGLGSVMGAVMGALWVVGIPAFFPDNATVPLFASSVGLLLVLMYFPGGLIQVAYSARDAIVGWAERRLPVEDGATKASVAPPTSITSTPVADRVVHDPMLSTKNITVRFGGNQALSDVSIDIEPHKIVGLIGTNGAGKSTFMNAIGGYIPSTGTVELLGKDITGASAPKRARLGLGRTFQAAGLFPELTVRETIQVALEGRGRTPFLTTALFLPPSGAIERRRRTEADELIDFLGLGRYADAYISDLSTGTRRIVELAGLLALDARVLCLDEPTAGVAQRETEAFGPLIRTINDELGASMLVIEHDMPLIMSISDKVYCLEAGQVIAAGLPDEVRNDPLVVASYLGTDQRAIDRSDS